MKRCSLIRCEIWHTGLLGVSPSVSSETVNTRPASPQMVEGLRIQNLHPTSATLSWELLVGTGQMGKNITLPVALVLPPPRKGVGPSKKVCAFRKWQPTPYSG